MEEEAQHIISKLPQNLHDEILLENHSKIITHWKCFTQNFSSQLLNTMKSIIKQQRFSPNDEIFNEGNT